MSRNLENIVQPRRPYACGVVFVWLFEKGATWEKVEISDIKKVILTQIVATTQIAYIRSLNDFNHTNKRIIRLLLSIYTN